MLAAPPARASTATIVGVIIALAISVAVIWSVLFSWSGLDVVRHATAGLIQPAFVAALLVFALVGSVMYAGSVSVADAGLVASDLRRALVVLLVVASGIQIGLVAGALISDGELHAGPALNDDPGTVAGNLIAHLLGTALVEEVAFRGFLLRQFLIRARARHADWRGVTLAVSAAALLFALYHIPQRMSLGLRGIDLVGSLAVVWVGGVLASYLYLRSGSLGIVIVLHALFNYSAPLVASPVPEQWILGGLVLVVIGKIELDARRHEARS
ncbi:MAG TPA: CPBP family intramembrane glutamic endopeptidase [Kofleriaceae bacterium]|nr:CPBP family intramembrane glutamic endopeptidase [Kofleriaceae bacterium]